MTPLRQLPDAPMLLFDSPSPLARRQPVAALCWSASPTLPEPEHPEQQAPTPATSRRRCTIDWLPVEILHVILTMLWHVCAAAPAAAAVCQLFYSVSAKVARELRASSCVKPRRFAITINELPAAMQLQSTVSASEYSQLKHALSTTPFAAKQLFYNRVLDRDGLLAVLDYKLPGDSQRTRGFLGDEEVNDLIALAIPCVRKGMGAGECISLPSTLFASISSSGAHCLQARSLGFKRPQPELFHTMMDTPLWVLPCNHSLHWWSFFFHIPCQRILVADSLGFKHFSFATLMLQWLACAHLWHTGMTLDTSAWEVWHISVPQQGDGKACGIFTWLAALHHCHGAPLDYSFTHIKFYRQVAALLLLRIRRQPLILSLD